MSGVSASGTLGVPCAGGRAGGQAGGRADGAVPGRSVRVACALATLLLGGCTTVGEVFSIDEVKPWERDVLAREDMQLVVDPMDDAVDDHLYFSREASSGGGSVRGGGCGCN